MQGLGFLEQITTIRNNFAAPREAGRCGRPSGSSRRRSELSPMCVRAGPPKNLRRPHVSSMYGDGFDPFPPRRFSTLPVHGLRWKSDDSGKDCGLFLRSKAAPNCLPATGGWHGDISYQLLRHAITSGQMRRTTRKHGPRSSLHTWPRDRRCTPVRNRVKCLRRNK